MVDQLTIDDRARSLNAHMPGLRSGRYLSLQERFDEWLATADGRVMVAFVVERARALKVRGFRHYGIKALWEAARYARDIQVGPNAGFRLNNDFTSRLARHVMAVASDLDGFFETRELKA